MCPFDILVIDDELDPRQAFFQERLQALGHRVTSALSSGPALDLLKTQRYDLAFFDHDLGESATGSTIAGQILYHHEEYHCPRAVWVHSANPVGAENIASKFRSVGVPTRRMEFGLMLELSDDLLNGLIAELLPSLNSESRLNEIIALIDMDSSLVDYEGRLRDRLLELMSPMEAKWFEDNEAGLLNSPPPWLKARERLIKHQPGFWYDLPVIPFGMELYRLFGDLGYTRMILTKGPHNNPTAWAEKTRWCEENVPGAGITITHDKGLVYGRVLYDDWPPYIRRWLEWRPRGKVLMLDAPYNRDFQHPNVLRCHRAPMYTQKELITQFLGT
jgi:5'-nucleotidase